MVTLNVTEEELQMISKALTDFYYRKPFNPLDTKLRRLQRNIKALAEKKNGDKKSA